MEGLAWRRGSGALVFAGLRGLRLARALADDARAASRPACHAARRSRGGRTDRHCTAAAGPAAGGALLAPDDAARRSARRSRWLPADLAHDLETPAAARHARAASHGHASELRAGGRRRRLLQRSAHEPHDAPGSGGGVVPARSRLRRAGIARPGVSAQGRDAAVRCELPEPPADVAALGAERGLPARPARAGDGVVHVE